MVGASTLVRRKCFISYHHDGDQGAVDTLIRQFDHWRNLFIARGLGQEMPGDVIDSVDPEYVMRRIRELFIADSSVTIVVMGRCTWARRYVDWEIQASLRYSEESLPNGLLGIRLSPDVQYPARFNGNLKHPGMNDCYARWMDWPSSEDELLAAIEAAYARRTTHKRLINNPRERQLYNSNCV